MVESHVFPIIYTLSLVNVFFQNAIIQDGQLNPCWKRFKKFLFTSEAEKGREIKQLRTQIFNNIWLYYPICYMTCQIYALNYVGLTRGY